MADRAQTITKIRYRWDTQPGVEPGWYCECFDNEGTLIVDSMKVWFPIEVDAFGQNQAEELETVLQAYYQKATIERE